MTNEEYAAFILGGGYALVVDDHGVDTCIFPADMYGSRAELYEFSDRELDALHPEW